MLSVITYKKKFKHLLQIYWIILMWTVPELTLNFSHLPEVNMPTLNQIYY